MEAVAEKNSPKELSKAPKIMADKVSGKPSRADSIVTARVPPEIREQGNKILRKIGSTPTELINAAYEYVLEYEALPEVAPPFDNLQKRQRELTPEQKKELRERLRKSTLKAPDSWSGKTYEELREEAMRERYPEYFAKGA